MDARFNGLRPPGRDAIATEAVTGDSSGHPHASVLTRLLQRLRLGVAARRGPRAGYDGFISYSHRADAEFAPVLQRALHGFARSWFRLRAMRVFRDVASLQANAGLMSAIEGVLLQTRFLILLASPAAAASPWVANEVEFWCDRRSSDTLLIALTDGRIEWSDAANDFDWTATTALPHVLAGRFAEEPLRVDLRWAKDAGQIGPRHPRLREAVATLAAAIYDRPRDELIGDDIRRHRRTLQVAATAAVLIVGFAGVATWQSFSARAQRDKARDQALQATSLALSAASRLQLASHPRTALLLGLEAYRMRPRAEARSAVVAALQVVGRTGSGPILRGHTDIARAAAFSPDGRTLVTGGDDKLVRVWNLNELREVPVSPLHGHTDLVMSVDVSPDGRVAASGSWDGTVRLWDLRRGTQIGAPLRRGDRVESVAFSPKGHLLAVGSDSDFELWQYETRKQLVSVQADDDVDEVAFDPAGEQVAGALASGDALVWNVRRAKGWSLHHGSIAGAVAFSADGRLLAVGGEGNPLDSKAGTVSVWNVRTHEAVLQPTPTGTELIRGVAFASDGKTLYAAGQEGLVARIDPAHVRVLGYVANVSNGIWGAAISHDRSTLAFPVSDGSIRMWYVGRRTAFGEILRGSRGRINAMSVDTSGRLVAVAHGSGWIDVWDVRGSGLVERLKQRSGRVSAVAFSPSGTTLAFAEGGNVRLWHLQTGGVVAMHARVPAVSCIAFSGDGRMLATGEFNGHVRLWSVADREQIGAPIATPKTYPREVEFVSFSADERYVAFAAGDFQRQSVRLVDVSTRRIVDSVDGIWPLDGGVVTADDTIRAASIKYPNLTLVTVHPSSVRELRVGGASALAFSPDGSTLAVGRDNGFVRLWDAKALEPLGSPLGGDRRRVSAVAFSGDGETLAAGTEDGVLRVWPHLFWNSFDELEQRVCRVAGSSITKEEWPSVAAGIPYRASCG